MYFLFADFLYLYYLVAIYAFVLTLVRFFQSFFLSYIVPLVVWLVAFCSQ